MRQGPNNKQRGRNNGGGNRGPYGGGNNGGGQRRSGVPSRNQNYDSSGPDVRIRGSAYQVYEKYLNLALDATSVGDRIMAESYYQHAEHYYRIINIIEYGPEDERRPDQHNNRQNNNERMEGQHTGHLYQPGYDGEGEETGSEHGEDGQPEHPSYDRNGDAARNNFEGQPPQPETKRYPQAPRAQNDRNQRFDNYQQRDNRRPTNEGPLSEPSPEDSQQPGYVVRPRNQERPQHQDRGPRDYGQRRDNRPALPENEETTAEMRGDYAARADEGQDEGPQALPAFIRRGGARPVASSPAESPRQDDEGDRPE